MYILIGVKKKEDPHQDVQKGGRTHFIELATLKRFYLQYFANNNLGTLVTGGLIEGRRLMEVWLYFHL